MFQKTPGQTLGKVLVAGATGKVGKIIVKKLAEGGQQVVAMARDPSCAAAAELRELENVEIVKADLRDRESLTEAVRGCASVVACVTNRPLRFSKVSDLWSDPLQDPTHPASLNYAGICNLIDASTESKTVRKLVRVSGLSVGLSAWNPISILFSLVLAFANKWNREGEIAIRASGLDYTVIRPAGLKDCPPASVTGDKLLLASEAWGMDKSPPATTGISREDVADLAIISIEDARLSNTTLRVSRMKRGTAGNFYMEDNRADYTWEPMIPSVTRDSTPLVQQVSASWHDQKNSHALPCCDSRRNSAPPEKYFLNPKLA